MAAFQGTPDTDKATARSASAVPAVRLERLVKRFGDHKVVWLAQRISGGGTAGIGR